MALYYLLDIENATYPHKKQINANQFLFKQLYHDIKVCYGLWAKMFSQSMKASML